MKSFNKILSYYLENNFSDDDLMNLYTKMNLFNVKTEYIDMSSLYDELGIYCVDLVIKVDEDDNMYFEGFLHVDYKFVDLFHNDSPILSNYFSNKHFCDVILAVETIENPNNYDKFYWYDSIMKFNPALKLSGYDFVLVSNKVKLNKVELPSFSHNLYLEARDFNFKSNIDYLVLLFSFLDNLRLEFIKNILTSEKSLNEEVLFLYFPRSFVAPNVMRLCHLCKDLEIKRDNIVLLFESDLNEFNSEELKKYFSDVLTHIVLKKKW